MDAELGTTFPSSHDYFTTPAAETMAGDCRGRAAAYNKYLATKQAIAAQPRAPRHLKVGLVINLLQIEIFPSAHAKARRQQLRSAANWR